MAQTNCLLTWHRRTRLSEDVERAMAASNVFDIAVYNIEFKIVWIQA